MSTGRWEAPRAIDAEDDGAELETIVQPPDFGAFAADATAGDAAESVYVIGPGVLFAGRYRIRHRIARGGMSTVWDALDERVDRVVALKLMSTHLADDADYCVRFEQEAKAAARLASPHVVALFDYGLHQGLPFMVLERLVGEDLHARTRRDGALTPEATIRIVEQTASALHAAHRAGIVHRDVKPHNLFLAEQDGAEVVKLLDFGVAKHAGTAALRTKTGLMVGSPYFMSPEQVRGAREVDARSDLFSLGAVAYLCLTGRTPFTGAMPAVFLAILDGRPPPPTSLRSDLPPAVDAFFARALATDPRERFSTAVEMAAALRGALDGEGRAPHAVSELRPVRGAARNRPRVVVLDDDEAPRPSAFPTAISQIPAEILRGESAPTVMPPSPIPSEPVGFDAPHGANDGDLPPVLVPAGSSPPVPRAAPLPADPALAVAPTPRIARAAVPVAPPPTVIVDEGALPPASQRDPGAGVGPGFSIAMRSYQPSVWAEPPRQRAPRRERLRVAVPLVLASMAGFVLAVAVLVIVWALFG